MTTTAGTVVELEAATARPKKRRRWGVIFFLVALTLGVGGTITYAVLQPTLFPTCSQTAARVVRIFDEGRQPLTFDGHRATVGELRQRCSANWDLEARQDIVAADTLYEMRTVLDRHGLTVTHFTVPREDTKTCTAHLRPGFCMARSECTGVSTPGLCSGGADVQCCTYPDL